MKFIFFGTPEFAAVILRKLIDGDFIPTAAVCNPDRPVGRKKIITAPPVKINVMGQEPGVKNKIKILQPEKLDEEFYNSLSMLHADFFVVAAYAKILPKNILGIPRLGAIGVHPSLLPRYRGASPIQSAILNGDEKTGVTLYLLNDKMDRGKIVSSVKCQVSSNDRYKTLERKLAELGGDLLVETLPKFLNGEIKPRPQNEAEATYTKKFTADDGFVEEKTFKEALSGKNPEAAQSIERKIRALTPEPGVWTLRQIQGVLKRTKLLAAGIQNNALILKTVQTEGKKPENL